MILKPDLSRSFVDPFTSHNTLVIFCDIMDPIKKIIMKEILVLLQKSRGLFKTTGIGDTIYFGPEPEYFVFDDVKMQIHEQSILWDW